jgi:two-component system, NtrC family, sensor histidine kinase HydH
MNPADSVPTAGPDAARSKMLAARGMASRFNLSRWFAIVSLVTIVVLSATGGMLLNWFLTHRLIFQEAALTSEFVHSVMMVETALVDYFSNPKQQIQGDVETAFRHIARIPDTIRFNAYSPDGTVIWSSDRQLIGRNFGPNDELESALTGAVVAKEEEADGEVHGKGEHVDLKKELDTFVEIYVPVTGERRDKVLGVIEFYRNPAALDRTLRDLRLYIVLGATSSALLLYLALFGLVRRADGIIRDQQQALVESETMAVIGEMSSAVAHGIRNPLATIRSSAELLMITDTGTAREAGQDIVAQSDRLEAWVRELLSYTRPIEKNAAPVEVEPLVARCIEDYERDMDRRNIRHSIQLGHDLPAVRGDALLLGQVLRSLLANSIEALGKDGRIIIRGERGEAGRVTISIEDNGPGIPLEYLGRAGKPFFTTKAKGLGVGLALSRRVVERFGGQMEIESTPGEGTAVRLHMRAA